MFSSPRQDPLKRIRGNGRDSRETTTWSEQNAGFCGSRTLFLSVSLTFMSSLKLISFYFYTVLFVSVVFDNCLLAFNIKCAFVFLVFLSTWKEASSHLCLSQGGPEGLKLPVSLLYRKLSLSEGALTDVTLLVGFSELLVGCFPKPGLIYSLNSLFVNSRYASKVRTKQKSFNLFLFSKAVVLSLVWVLAAEMPLQIW